MMLKIDFDRLRQGMREAAADLRGASVPDMEHNADEQFTVATDKTSKRGHKHWEIRRITYRGGTPDFYEHRDRKASGNWEMGLPEGLKKGDLLPADPTGAKPMKERKAKKKRARAKQGTKAANDAIAPMKALEAARTIPAILDAVARLMSLDEPTPSESELCEFVESNGGRLVLQTGNARTDAENEGDPFEFESLGWQVVHNTGAIGTPIHKHLALVESLIYPDHPHGKTYIHLGNVEETHLNWVQEGSPRSEHLLVELIRAWQRRLKALAPDTKQIRIVPKGLLGAAPAAVYVDESQHDPRLLPMTGYVEEPESLQLSLLPTTDTKSDLPPVTPLIMASAAGFGALTLGRGARLDKRILIYSLLSMPLHQRRPGGRYEWRPTLRELTGLLWTKDTWRPNKHARALEAAFDAVTLAKIRLPDGRLWLPVVARGRPNYGDLDSQAVIQLEVPELCDRGPYLDFPKLVAEGRISDPAFDLWLSLAYLWDDAKARNGGHRIYATRPKALRNAQGFLIDAKGNLVFGHPDNPFNRAGKLYWKPGSTPQRDWRHPQAVLAGEERHPHADKVPSLHPEARRRLAYGLKEQSDRANRTHERKNADHLLGRLESAGRVVIERDGSYWRILEARPKTDQPAL